MEGVAVATSRLALLVIVEDAEKKADQVLTRNSPSLDDRDKRTLAYAVKDLTGVLREMLIQSQWWAELPIWKGAEQAIQVPLDFHPAGSDHTGQVLRG
jgi:hypothetical protein